MDREAVTPMSGDLELKPDYASFLELNDTIYEEVIKEGVPAFACSTKGRDIKIVRYAPSLNEGYVTLPQPLDKEEIREQMITLLMVLRNSTRFKAW